MESEILERKFEQIKTVVSKNPQILACGDIMSNEVEEIINLIDVRIKINKELIPKVKSQEKIKKKAKIEELEYLKETILLAYED